MRSLGLLLLVSLLLLLQSFIIIIIGFPAEKNPVPLFFLSPPNRGRLRVQQHSLSFVLLFVSSFLFSRTKHVPSALPSPDGCFHRMPEIVLAMRIELDGVPAELVATAASTTTRGTVVHFFFFFFVGGGGVFVFVFFCLRSQRRGRRDSAMTMLLYNTTDFGWIKIRPKHISNTPLKCSTTTTTNLRMHVICGFVIEIVNRIVFSKTVTARLRLLRARRAPTASVAWSRASSGIESGVDGLPRGLRRFSSRCIPRGRECTLGRISELTRTVRRTGISPDPPETLGRRRREREYHLRAFVIVARDDNA